VAAPNTRCGRVKRFAPVWSRFVLGNFHVSLPRFAAAFLCRRARQYLGVRRRLSRHLDPVAEQGRAIHRVKGFEQLPPRGTGKRAELRIRACASPPEPNRQGALLGAELG